jgi:hypothetical protein
MVGGKRFRKRKCDRGHSFVTEEKKVEVWPYIDPRRKTKKPKAKKKPAAPVYTPAEKWNLAVTKDSPMWLKNIVLQLG